MEVQDNNNKPKKRIFWRILAIVLALILVAELIVSSLIRISFSAEKYEEDLTSKAAQVILSREEYLKKSLLQREADLISSQLSNDPYAVYATRASVAIGLERYAEAAEYLGQCLEYYHGGSDEELALIHLKRAGLYILSNDLKNAAPELDEVLKLEPKNADALYLRIQLALRREDYESAAVDALTYESVAEVDPDSMKAFAGIYDMAGDIENALRVYTLLLENPDTKEISFYAARARIRLLAEDVENARVDLETFFLEGGTDENGVAALLLCGCYLQEGEYQEAKTAYESALENGAEPKAELKNWLAAACIFLEDYEYAEKLLDEILKEDASYDGASYLKGLCCYSTEKYKEAVEAFTASVELGQEILNSLYYRGLSELLLGSVEAAEEDFEKVAAGEDEELAASAEELLETLHGEHDHDHDHK